MRLLIITIFIMMLVIPAEASFGRGSSSARALGMGGAFSAIATDLSATAYNPSLLALMYYPQISFNYAKPFPNMNDGSNVAQHEIIFGSPLLIRAGRKKDQSEINAGAIALGYSSFFVNSLYSEQVIKLSYAKETVKNLYAGFNYNMLTAAYKPGTYANTSVDNQGNVTNLPDPLFAKGKSKSGSRIDAALSYILDINRAKYSYDRYCFSIVQEGLFTTGMQISGAKAQPKKATRLGLGYNHNVFKMDFDYTRTNATNAITDNIFAFGLERWFSLKKFGRTALRSGISIGTESANLFTVGVSYLYRFYMLDYAFIMPVSTFEDVGCEHRISFTVRFGKVDYDFEANPMLKKSMEERLKISQELQNIKDDTLKKKKQAQQLEEELETARSQQGGYWKSSPDTAQRQQDSYNASMSLYKKLVDEQATYKDRTIYIENMLQKYKTQRIDVSELEQELEKLNRVMEQGKENYNISWNYYQKNIERGADVRQRRRLLLDIKKKFAYLGIDLSVVENELKAVEKEMRK